MKHQDNNGDQFLEFFPNMHHLLNLGDNEPRKPFVENPDIVAVGCSNTWGVGVDDHEVWPEVLAQHLGMTVNVVAEPGRDIGTLVPRIFNHIEQWGKPTYICCLWPEIWRAHVNVWKTPHNPWIGSTRFNQTLADNSELDTVNLSIHYSGDPTHYVVGQTPYMHVSNEGWRDERPKPYRLWPEQFITQNLEYMFMLEKFGKILGIEVYQTSWSASTNNTLKPVLESFRLPRHEYRDTRPRVDPRFKPEHCTDHQPLLHQQAYWEFGNDGHHPGIHDHIHIAEHFAGHMQHDPLIKNR